MLKVLAYDDMKKQITNAQSTYNELLPQVAKKIVDNSNEISNKISYLIAGAMTFNKAYQQISLYDEVLSQITRIRYLSIVRDFYRAGHALSLSDHKLEKELYLATIKEIVEEMNKLGYNCSATNPFSGIKITFRELK